MNKKATINKNVKTLLEGVVDEVTVKSGIFTAREGYFYRMGKNETVVANRIKDILLENGLSVQIIDKGDHWANFVGGASLKKSSHWFVVFSVSDIKNWREIDNTPFDDSDFDNWQGTIKADESVVRTNDDYIVTIQMRDKPAIEKCWLCDQPKHEGECQFYIDSLKSDQEKPAPSGDLTWLLSDEDITFNKDQEKPAVDYMDIDDIENCCICGKRFDIQGNCPNDCVLELLDPYAEQQAANELKFCQEYVRRFADHKDELDRWHDEGLRLAYPTESGWYWHRSGIWVTDLPLPEGSVSTLKKGGARQKGNTLFITIDDISYPIGNVESD